MIGQIIRRLGVGLGIAPPPDSSAGGGATSGTGRPTPPPQSLIERINRNGDINDPDTPRPLLTLEEFFEGNDDYGSIGCNFHQGQPAPSEFYALFLQIRERPEVENVLVEVKQQEMPDEWPFTDTVWIITSATAESVREWLGKRFAADEYVIGWDESAICWPEEEQAVVQTLEPYPVPHGMQPIGVFWD